MLEYVDLATARSANGTRIVTSSLLPSPWSEAAKGMFTIAKLPAMVVARGRDVSEFTVWTGIDNVPVVLHDEEPARSNWAAIVGLAARLAPSLLPTEPAARAEVMGYLELLAGEGGIGWNARLAMIHTSLTEGRGFPAPVAERLAKRYGYTPAIVEGLQHRVAAQLEVLASRLRGEYFGGSEPNALDVYSATFLTPLGEIDETTCPQMLPALRAAFATARELVGDRVPAALWSHRTNMFTQHLALPIRLS
jgi:glutathione S-transferase